MINFKIALEMNTFYQKKPPEIEECYQELIVHAIEIIQKLRAKIRELEC
jgi:hypothetical protein